MFKKTMTFDDLEGNETTQTFYFNFTKKEVAEMIEFDDLEGMLKKLNTPPEESGLTQQENTQMAYDAFQTLILKAFGIKGADNVSFEKSEETKKYLRNHVAFSDIIFEFIEKPALAAEFIEKCLPPRLVNQAKTEMVRDTGRKIDDVTLAEMVQEAARRQEDPATRIEPGIEAAREALGENPEVEALAGVVKAETDTTEKKITIDDIMTMSDEDFDNLDVRGLEPHVLQAAFARKTRPKA